MQPSVPEHDRATVRCAVHNDYFAVTDRCLKDLETWHEYRYVVD